jgi:hypothetical protein
MMRHDAMSDNMMGDTMPRARKVTTKGWTKTKVRTKQNSITLSASTKHTNLSYNGAWKPLPKTKREIQQFSSAQ